MNSNTTKTNPSRVVLERASSSSSSSALRPTLPAPPPQSDFLVSEHEDNDCEQDAEDTASTIIVNDSTDNPPKPDVDPTTTTNAHETTAHQPFEIPPTSDNDDESEYEYDYEDDEYGQYSGFLVTQPVFGATETAAGTSSATIVPQDSTAHAHAHADGVAAARGTGERKNVVEADEDSVARPLSPFPVGGVAVAVAGGNRATVSSSGSGWKEPSREAVSMSLRVEKEKTGGRRRLAADLYRIMTHDTEDAGFSISPAGEDRMDSWTIRLFKFDEDSNLHRDLKVLGIDHVELEMNFPDEYPFKPPFVRVVRPRFKRQTGFVMNGALCMELLTNEGWNPINDIESVIVSIRSLLVVGDGRLQAAEKKDVDSSGVDGKAVGKRKREDDDDDDGVLEVKDCKRRPLSRDVGEYTTAEAKAAYSHLSNFHKKKGWSHWWSKKG